jgi:transcriptional regulator with XRE-family HTH domain
MREVGHRIKVLRKRLGLSQRELARRAGITNASVSLIERNQMSPSVASLKKVLDSLGVSMAEFFSGRALFDDQIFFRAEELTEIGENGVSFRQVGQDLDGRALQVLHEFYQPGADTGEQLYTHTAEESGIVVRGEIEITVGAETRKLGPGDAYYFDSRIPHRFRNTGSEECEIVSSCTPPTF